MSSFFANNAMSSNNHKTILAFFIPQGAFQQNNQIQDIRLMKPRYIKTETQREQPKEEIFDNHISQQSPQNQQNNYSKSPAIPQKQISTKNTEIKRRTIQSKTDTTKKIKDTEITESIPSSKYQLEDNQKNKSTTTSETSQIAEVNIKDLHKKSLKELLSEIPYPDSHQPKFKQLYGLYGLELRSFQRRGKFPINRDQEDALAKANSTKRFTIQ